MGMNIWCMSLPQGSHDPDGAPIVVFTASRHDAKGSELKATMQLLFYMLDEVAER